MSRALIPEIEEMAALETAGVCPCHATDADLPSVFWPDGEAPAVTFDENIAAPLACCPARAPVGLPGGDTTGTNPSGSPRRRDWHRVKRLDSVDGYCVLLRIEARFWEARERIPEVQAILDFCRRAVMRGMGYASF